MTDIWKQLDDRLDAEAKDPILARRKELEEHTERANRQTITRAQTVNPDPDRYANVHDLSERFGVSPDVVGSALEDFQAKDELEGKARTAEKNPTLSWWLRQNQSNASLVSKADMEHESERDGLFSRIAAQYKAGGEDIDLGLLQFDEMNDPGASAERTAAISMLETREPLPEEHGASRFPTSTARILPFTFGTLDAGVRGGVAAGAIPAALTYLGPQVAEPLSTGAGTAATVAITGFGARAGAVRYSAMVEAGHAYSEFKKMHDEDGNLIEPEVARVAAQAYGVAAGAVEIAGLGLLLKAVPGGKALMAGLTRQAVKDMLKRRTVTQAIGEFLKVGTIGATSEIGEEGVQFALQVLLGEAAKSASELDITPLDKEEKFDEFFETLEEAAYAAPLLAFTPAGGGLTVNVARALDANQNEAFMRDLANGVEGSELRKRASGSFQKLVARQASEGGIPNLRIPVEAWDTYFQPARDESANAEGQPQEPKPTPEDFARELGILEAYVSARESGGDIVIPTEIYADKIAGTAHHGILSENVRIGEDGMTMREASDFKAQFGEQLEAVIGQAEAESKSARASNAQTAEIQEAVLRELEVAGAFTPEIRSSYAQLIAQGYQAISSRNEDFDARELFAGHRLVVRGPGQGAPQPLNQAIENIDSEIAQQRQAEQSEEGDARLEELLSMRGDLVSRAQSVLELRRRGFGGLVDDALEALVGRDPLSGEAGETAQASHLEELGSRLDDMLERAASVQADFNEMNADAEALLTADRRQADRIDRRQAEEEVTEERREEDRRRAEEVVEPGPTPTPEDPELFQPSRSAPRDLVGTLFSRSLRRIRGEETELFQPSGEDGQGPPRGSFKRIDTGAMIRLGESADLSTFLHESGHVFLDMLELASTTPGASEQLVADYAQLRSYLGASEGQPLGTEQHEKFADAFGQYLFEAKAPSRDLVGPFQDFKVFLQTVYRNFREIFGHPPPEEVQDVMSRMLATEAQIQDQAQQDGFTPAFREEAPHGVTEASWTSYRAIVEEAGRQAEENATARSLKGVRRWLQAEWRNERDAVREEVKEELRHERRIQARHWISRGEWIGDRDDPIAESLAHLNEAGHLRLRQEELLEDYGAEVLAAMPRGPKNGIMANKGAEGLNYSDMASQFGYETMDEFVNDMARTGTFEIETREETKRRFTKPRPEDVDVVAASRAELANPKFTQMLRSQLALLRRLKARELLEGGAEQEILEEGPGSAAGRRDAVDVARGTLEEAQVAWEIAYAGGSEALLARSQAKITESIAALDAAMARREAAKEPRKTANAHERALKLQADNRVLITPIMDLNPNADINDMRRASERVREHVAREEWQDAEKEQLKQIYFLHHYKASVAARERSEKQAKAMRAYAKRPAQERLAKAGGQFLAQMNRLLASVALRGPISEAEAARASALRAWQVAQQQRGDTLPIDPARLEQLMARRHWREMTVGELEELAYNARVISRSASRAKKLLQGIQAQEVEAKAEELSTSILVNNVNAITRRTERLGAEGIPPSIRRMFGGEVPDRPGTPENPPWHEKGRKYFRAFAAEFKHMETFMLWLDGNDELGVNYRFFITDGARKAQAAEDLLKDEMAAGIRRVFRDYGAWERMKIGSKKSAVWIPELKQSMTLEERILFVANTGNAYNLGALKAGYGLDQATDAFGPEVRAVMQTLEDRDWNAVQEMWDLLDTFWDRIASHHEAMTGMRPERVEGRAFTAPNGKEMRGGYFPLRADAQKTVTVQQRRQEKLTESLLTFDYVAGTTKHGMTNARAEWGNQRVALNFNVFFSHLHDVAHDISHRRFVRDAIRMIDRKDFREAVEDAAGEEYIRVLRQWTMRLSELTIEPLGATTSLFKQARIGTTVVNMGLKMSVMMAQWTAIIPATVIIGPKAAFKGSYLVGSSWGRAVGEKMVGMTMDENDSRRFAMENSTELQHRMKSWDRDVSAAKAEFGFGSIPQRLTTLQFYLIGYIDLQVATAAWLGGYDRGLQDGMSEQDAMAFGDRVVSTTQGGAKPYQLAEIQTGSETYKMITMFYTFWSAMYNLTSERASKARRGNAKAKAEFIHEMFWLYVIMPMVAEILAGRSPADDDEEWGEWAAKAIGANALSPIPVVRNISSVLMGWQFQFTPVESAFESPVLLLSDMARGAAHRADGSKGEDPIDRDTLDHLINTLAYFSPVKLGTRQITGSIRQIEALLEGDDFSMKRLIYGRPPPRNTRTTRYK